MNCEECKEKVLELIEREAVDPEGVREILARCPDCRAAFDEAKALLAIAAELPLEKAPAAADAAILRAAAARRPKVVSLRRPWYASPQWAVAAIALLAVGVGVWAIPRQVQLEGDEDPIAAREEAAPSDANLAIRSPAKESEPQAPTFADETASGDRRRAAVKSNAARQDPARAKRKSGVPGDQPVAPMAKAPAARQDLASGAAAESLALEAEVAEPEESKKERGELSAACREKLRRVERSRRVAKAAKVPAEEALAIGRCYQAAGNDSQARVWLQRAAAHAETKKRAERALDELSAD